MHHHINREKVARFYLFKKVDIERRTCFAESGKGIWIIEKDIINTVRNFSFNYELHLLICQITSDFPYRQDTATQAPRAVL